MNKIVEVLNIEICMIDNLIEELTELKKSYKGIYDASDRTTGDLNLKFKLEDLLLANDEIKRKLLNIMASRDAWQERFVKELGELYTSSTKSTKMY